MSNINDLMQIINSPEFSDDIQKRREEISIALKIKEKRQELGWTQAELAAKMGVAQNVISRIESLEGGISSGTIAKFCKATGQELSFKQAGGKLSILDISNYIQQYGKKVLDGAYDISNKKLNKLLFFVEIELKKVLGARYFDFRIEAWLHGPVYPELYHRYKVFGYDTIKEPFENIQLPQSIIEHINKALDHYLPMSAYELEEESHKTKEYIEAGYENGRIGLELII
jgi:uncharacterized phage-associated protein/DNA-binding Xre family transcriptional regulator